VTVSAPPSPPAPPPPAEPRSLWRGLLHLVARHPWRFAQGLFVALLVIVVLQNLEPTSIDVLFWSIPSLPKLVVILIAMLAGGVVWEIARRLLVR
jgi:uncharacterized integral membrane protein